MLLVVEIPTKFSENFSTYVKSIYIQIQQFSTLHIFPMCFLKKTNFTLVVASLVFEYLRYRTVFLFVIFLSFNISKARHAIKNLKTDFRVISIVLSHKPIKKYITISL